MRNYYMNETEGKIYTENEMNKVFAADDDKRFDDWQFIGKFKSRKAARKFYIENC